MSSRWHFGGLWFYNATLWAADTRLLRLLLDVLCFLFPILEWVGSSPNEHVGRPLFYQASLAWNPLPLSQSSSPLEGISKGLWNSHKVSMHVGNPFVIASVDESAEATPKSVMRVMSVKGLTLYHLKSHLQVRIFPCLEQIIARYSLAVWYEELVISFM